MDTLERIDRFRRLWGIIVQVGVPTDAQFYRWTRFSDSVFEHALKRTAAKARTGEVRTLDAAERYATGVMLKEEAIGAARGKGEEQ